MSSIPKVAFVEAQTYRAQVVVDGSKKILDCVYIESYGLNIKSNGSVSPRSTPRTPYELQQAINTTLHTITHGKRVKGELVQSQQDRSSQLYLAMCDACEKSLSQTRFSVTLIDEIVTAYKQKNPKLKEIILRSVLFKKAPLPSEKKEE